jgi:hypothetical protein
MRRRHTHPSPLRHARVAIVTVVLTGLVLPTAGATPLGPKPSSADAKLRELQKKREQVRAAKAKSASSVDALQATDAEIQEALADLNNNIEGQTALLEESQRAVAAAEAEQAEAKASEAKNIEELSTLRTSIKDQAIRAFIESPSDETLDLLSADSLADAARERTLRSVQASNSLDATEQYKKVQEDLAIARAKSEAAAAKANTRRQDVTDRLARLESAHDEQEKFAAEVDNRMDAALAEADALKELDGALSSSISSQQQAIAAQLAAQRAAAKTRGRSSGSPGSSVAIPAITDGGSIVTVNGIRVHQDIANNLANLLNAASAAGIQLGGGGYRDPQAQIATRRNNCGSSSYAIYQAPASSCSPPTARPGQSMHERGLAVDFTSGGGTLTRGSAAFAWMKANAGQYGFYNLPSEPWHWSTNGN